MAKNPPSFPTFEESFPVILSLSDEEAGRLYKAKAAFWMSGEKPTFDDSDGLRLAWMYEEPRLVAARHSYYLTSVKNRFKVYLRECEKHGETTDSISAWFETLQVRNRTEGWNDTALEEVTISELSR
jgi:hypothetical protein